MLFIYFLIERDFLIHAHIFPQPIKMQIWQHITNQNSCCIKTVFTYSRLNISIDQWEGTHYPNYFIIDDKDDDYNINNQNNPLSLSSPSLSILLVQ